MANAPVPTIPSLPYYELASVMNDIVQPLRFYDNSNHLLIKRHEALNYLNFVPLIVDPEYLIPFELFSYKYEPDYHELTIVEATNEITGAVTNLLPFLNFSFYFDNASNPTRQYIQYWGVSAITPILKHGYYSLHLKSTEGEWWSDRFKVGIYSRTIRLEYTNATPFSGLIVGQNALHLATYEGYTFDQGEYSRHSVINKDENNYDVYNYRRSDKLRTCIVRGDSNVVDLLELVQMCDTIYLTDELGKKSLIEMVEIQPEPISQSNYLNITFKYRIIGNALNTTNLTPSTLVHIQVPPGVTPPEEDGNAITIGGEPITIGGEQITIGN